MLALLLLSHTFRYSNSSLSPKAQSVARRQTLDDQLSRWPCREGAECCTNMQWGAGLGWVLMEGFRAEVV